MLSAFILVTLSLSFFTSAASVNMAEHVVLDDAVDLLGARCLDGSPPHYYWRQSDSSVNASKWYLHIEGGGWCVSVADCAGRANSRLGSSRLAYGYPPVLDLDTAQGCGGSRWCGAPILNDRTQNPMTWDWNAVFLAYCDGGSWTGNNETVSEFNGTQLYFRGHRNLEAIFLHLLASRGLDQATDVIVGGDSAGGLATYLHIDYIRSLLPAKTRLVGAPDSGFFPGLGWSLPLMPWLYEQMNSTVNAKCAANQPAGQTYRCLFADVLASYVSTPLFVVQSQFDPTQPMNCNLSDASCVNAYGQKLIQMVNSTLLNRQTNAAWMYSCFQHCGGWLIGESQFNGIDALQAFYYGETQQRVWFQNYPYPCDACCQTPA